jgi:lipopolysaccharide assembly LptE-like protein
MPRAKIRRQAGSGAAIIKSAELKPSHWQFRTSTFTQAWLLITAMAILELLSGGCAGYKLGPTNGVVAGEKSVQIMPFSNQTLEPRLGDTVTEQLRKRLQRDGSYRVATHDDGDILVTGTLTAYRRLEVSFVPTDILTVRDYRLTMTGLVTARERSTGKILLTNQTVTGSTLIRVGSDLTSAERQAMPLLAGDFARNVTALLVDGSW